MLIFHLFLGYFGFLHEMIYNTAKFKTITISEGVALLMARTADPVFSPVMAALGTIAAACQQIDLV